MKYLQELKEDVRVLLAMTKHIELELDNEEDIRYIKKYAIPNLINKINEMERKL